MLRTLCFTFVLFYTQSAFGQAAEISLGTSAFDRTQQVEVTSDELTLDQSSGEAVFDGNVLVVQGEVRMSADRVAVAYNQGGSGAGISKLSATGGVTFVTPTDAVEARQATYSVDDGTVVLTGDVILTQGQTAISGEKLTVNLSSGAGRISGRVRTIFNAQGDQ